MSGYSYTVILWNSLIGAITSLHGSFLEFGGKTGQYFNDKKSFRN